MRTSPTTKTALAATAPPYLKGNTKQPRLSQNSCARQSISGKVDGQMGAVLCWSARMRSLLAGEGGGEVLGEEMGDCFKKSKLILAHTRKRQKRYTSRSRGASASTNSKGKVERGGEEAKRQMDG